MRKLRSLAGVGVRRTLGRLQTADSRRLLLSVCGVALAIALMTTVTGISLGLAAGSTVRGEQVDYWVVPEQGSASTVAVSVDGPQLGSVHTVTKRLSQDKRIDYVTPVQLRILRVHAGNSSEYILMIGLIPSDDGRRLMGLSTDPLHPGDPYYANGTYSGPWTGEAVLSDAASKLLNATPGDEVTPMGTATNETRTFTVQAVETGDVSTGVGPVPVALVHLSELQQLSGATSGDQANQLLVSTNSPAVREKLAHVYPRTKVIARGGLNGPSLSTSSLSMAVALAALLSAVVVGALFVATLSGLDVTADRSTFAMLSALGYSQRSQSVLVVVQTVTTCGVGGLLGVVLGGVGIVLVNTIASSTFGVGSIARFHPALVIYGVGVALGIGLIAAPYPIWLSRRTDVLEVLDS